MQANGYIKKVQKKKVSEEIMEQLARLIREGVWQAREKLPSEKEMEEMFGVSRTSVREALTGLAAIGAIEMRQGGGHFVRRLDFEHYINPLTISLMAHRESILQLLELRRIIEVEAAALAAERARPEDLQRMEEALDAMENEVRANKVAHEWDFRFHMALVESTQNPLLVKVIHNVAGLFDQALEQTRKHTRTIPGRPLEVVREHRRIFLAIQAGDGTSASRCMREHLDNVQKKLL
ncbi:hypothetical protein SY88_16545 [Clostridiales bacterium PH28_bin88]|nr:hypothetical protein SY88_16545 [Clostridiales bacterium PH28_bin88]